MSTLSGFPRGVSGRALVSSEKICGSSAGQDNNLFCTTLHPTKPWKVLLKRQHLNRIY